MMVSDLDIYGSARFLIDQHGTEAPIHAAMRADAMLERGDLDGRAVSQLNGLLIDVSRFQTCLLRPWRLKSRLARLA